ncbi:MAG TPA: SRPBCC domain-containing protein [Mycobacterium sp.]|nr:SRPBCC domain-containing protein [Mycobacterium sp.]HTX94087.1 SRPBCC domain-containing protein [Mycobacterium sp.]
MRLRHGASRTAWWQRCTRSTPASANERVVEEFEFETSDPTLAGLMRMTTTLADPPSGTDVVVLHDGIPPGVSAEDNEIGTRMALDKLATFVAAPPPRSH